MMWGYDYQNWMTSIIPLLIIPLGILDVVLKGFALWKSAQRKEKVWFIALLLVNSLGILPTIYLLLNQKTSKPRI
ncbi:MAG: DUF5652 family protein [Patescibacteria group bacterium]